VSWELASFVVLFAALAAGFAWYERAQPTSRMLALVATLAALAAIGRIAFAPLPNVKPTTDIVLLAGYALGGAPGFVVGAVTALASNLVFGQGPWTPWQMVAWGLVGVVGALLGRVTGRRAGRVPLALTCGAAGLMFGAIMDASIWVTYGGQQTAGQYAAIAATSLPFNLAHAAGNVVFALAFGPVLVRALLRYRARLEVRWADAPDTGRAVGAANVPGAAVALLLAAVVGGAALLAPADAQAAPRGVTYLVWAQNADGGWGPAPRARTNAVQTSWAVVAIAAAGYDPLSVRGRGRTPLALLRRYASRSRSVADLERTALALAAAGLSPNTGGLAGRLRRAQRADGSFGGLVNLTSYGVLALRAGGASPRSRAVRRAAAWVARRQNRDGGFNFARRGAPSGIDDTAGAVQALAAAGGRRWRPVRRGAAFLARQQNADGGFPLGRRGRSNAQSTALAVQALVAARRNPDRQRRRGARSPLAYLRSLQGRDGAFRYSRTSGQTPVWVTAQALAALARRPLPVRIRRR
jgi:energy-coupling factor transport system substrate-specific component